MQKKFEKKFLVSEIIASEMAAVNCLSYEGNACHNKSMRFRSSFKTLHVSKRDFLQRNCLHNDQ